MSVIALDAEAGGSSGPWIMACEHCHWSTLEAGIQFEKPVSLFNQLSKIDPTWTSKGTSQPTLRGEKASGIGREPDGDVRFTTLRNFYNSQISQSNPSNPFASPQGDINYNSPSSLARIMSLYTGGGKTGKKNLPKPTPMREASDAVDGLSVLEPSVEADAVKQLQDLGWACTTNFEQRNEQPHRPFFLSSLRPVPTLLRTKRSKRCRTCRHILVKPDPRIQNLRYRIKLVALNYVPTMTIKPMQPAPNAPNLCQESLPAMRPLQFLLTLRNPMFDAARISLATQPVTPGRFGTRVTILCPQFDIGANADVWDEALDGDGRKAGQGAKTVWGNESSDGRIAEAGKVWSRGRNWTTVVLEVVCARIDAPSASLEDNEDVLEVPIFVRIEYQTEVGGEEGNSAGSGREGREKRELAYWSVLGIGKISTK